mmetsp:Transcript_16225/g.48225  ORF Transcript_16225/g.48225 Transcript_16225/m.48225 type:complete len:335 (+) Transcript_16225:885-1889(+)
MARGRGQPAPNRGAGLGRNLAGRSGGVHDRRGGLRGQGARRPHVRASDFGRQHACRHRRRLHHDRVGHGPRAHRARTRHGRLHRRTEVWLGGRRPCRRQGRFHQRGGPGQPRRRKRPEGRQPKDHRFASGAGLAAAGTGLQAQVPVRLAEQEACDFPRHASMVRKHRRAADTGLGRREQGRVHPGQAVKPHAADAREPERLVHFAAALMGRAHPSLLQKGHQRRAPDTGDRAPRPGDRSRKRYERVVRASRGGPVARGVQGGRGAVREGHRHDGRVVRLGLLLGGRPRGIGLPCRFVPRGLRPAPRLVPVVVDHLCCGTGLRALQDRDDARLHG